MKVEVKHGKAKEVKPFPKLMVNICNGVIVLFSDEKAGTVLSGTDYIKTGTIAINTSPGEYKDFEGEITLSND